MKKLGKLEIVIIACYLELLLVLTFSSLSEATMRSSMVIEGIYDALYSMVIPVVIINVIASVILFIKSIKDRRLIGILISLPTFIIFAISLFLIMLSV